MRRMRDFSWQYLLFIIPAVVAVLGVQYLNRKSHKGSPAVSIAMNSVKTGSTSDSDGNEELDETTATAQDLDAQTDQVYEKVAANTVLFDNACKSIEFPGGGAKAAISTDDWNQVLEQFHNVKQDLSNYLAKQKLSLPIRTYAMMEAQIINLKIQRPPIEQQPDLSWRGIGVFAQDGAPLILVGGGFVKLIKENPSRGKFELARLAAQAWSPCEIKKTESTEPWSEMLSCLGIDDAQGCANSAYSEAGWVVSSVVAAVVAPPGCTIPAFAGVEVARCLKTPPQVKLIEDRSVASVTPKKESLNKIALDVENHK